MKNKFRQFSPIKSFLIESIKINKIKSILLIIFCFLLFLTGIIVACRTGASNPDNIFGYALKEGSFKIITSSFFTRLLSTILIMALLFVFSLNKYLFPLGLLLLCYRSYLLGLNICFMIIIYGFSGAILSIFIITPCHLIIISALILFYIILIRTRYDFCCFGGCRFHRQRLFVSIFSFALIFCICLVESLLLTIFSANVILII